MRNKYEAAEAFTVGSAEELILGIKPDALGTDNEGVSAKGNRNAMDDED